MLFFLNTDVNLIGGRLLVFGSLAMVHRLMWVVVLDLHGKHLDDVHWLCSDIRIPTG